MCNFYLTKAQCATIIVKKTKYTKGEDMENMQNREVAMGSESDAFKTTDDLISVWLSRNPSESTKVRIMKFLPVIAIGILFVLLYVMYAKTQSFTKLDFLEQIDEMSGHTNFMKFMLFLCALMLCIALYGNDLRNDYILYKVSNWLRETHFNEGEYFSYLADNNIDIFKGTKYDKSVEAIYASKNVSFRRILMFKIAWFIISLIVFEVISTTILDDEYVKAFIESGTGENGANNLRILASVIGFVVIMAPGFIYDMILSVKSAKWAEKFIAEQQR